jgi:hypothetical protein
LLPLRRAAAAQAWHEEIVVQPLPPEARFVEFKGKLPFAFVEVVAAWLC